MSEEAAPATSQESDRSRVAKAKLRAKKLLKERDEARRERDGLAGRLKATEAELAGLKDQLAAVGRERDEARAQVTEQIELHKRQVDRLEREIASVRDAKKTQGKEARKAVEAAEAKAAAAAAKARNRPRTPEKAAPPAAVEGVPRLDGTSVATTDVVRALVFEAADLVVVDGYNVTKKFQAGATLADQRTWLINLLTAAAGRTATRFVVVFDGSDAAPVSTGRPGPVDVQFSPEGVTADDDIDMLVAAQPDEARVLVVTEDRELRARVGASGADIAHPGEFVAAVRGR